MEIMVLCKTHLAINFLLSNSVDGFPWFNVFPILYNSIFFYFTLSLLPFFLVLVSLTSIHQKPLFMKICFRKSIIAVLLPGLLLACKKTTGDTINNGNPGPVPG